MDSVATIFIGTDNSSTIRIDRAFIEVLEGKFRIVHSGDFYDDVPDPEDGSFDLNVQVGDRIYGSFMIKGDRVFCIPPF